MLGGKITLLLQEIYRIKDSNDIAKAPRDREAK